MITILFDATRLLRRGGRRSPTGIDRVVLAYARWLCELSDVTLVPVWTWGDRVVRISDRRFQALMRLPLSSRDDQHCPEHHPQWADLLRALASPAVGEPGLRPSPERRGTTGRLRSRLNMALRFLRSLGAMGLPQDALYMNVGHSGIDRPELLARLDRVGIRSVVMIHDLIPITYPEFCGPGAADRHHRRIDATLKHASAILTNSEATAQDVRNYAAGVSASPPPIVVAPLGLEPTFLRSINEPWAAAPYFVCVGTIEPRKNIVLLLKLWRRLADRLGPSTPRLVLIGRRGWENETVLDHLQRSPPVRQFVHEIADLRDEEVAQLIRGARALLAPSSAEGYDLPVVEALSLSTPVIASNIPVHRELAHGAILLDPTDGPAWLREISAAAACSRRVSTIFIGPTWEDHFHLVRQLMLNVEAGAPVGLPIGAHLPRRAPNR